MLNVVEKCHFCVFLKCKKRKPQNKLPPDFRPQFAHFSNLKSAAYFKEFKATSLQNVRLVFTITKALLIIALYFNVSWINTVKRQNIRGILISWYSWGWP